ncbi:MAG: hypothetical protein Ct9H300mP19_11100 [Dehalococcoidia bacterium]|nr:MAG: hypothetical protein Ct9H300mP19_11100 [Dehalococcoidia bacterium]
MLISSVKLRFGFCRGSYGGKEFHMGEPEKVLSIKTVVEAHAGRKFVIAGIDALSPTEAVRLSNLYPEAGADRVGSEFLQHW